MCAWCLVGEDEMKHRGFRFRHVDRAKTTNNLRQYLKTVLSHVENASKSVPRIWETNFIPLLVYVTDEIYKY